MQTTNGSTQAKPCNESELRTIATQKAYGHHKTIQEICDDPPGPWCVTPDCFTGHSEDDPDAFLNAGLPHIKIEGTVLIRPTDFNEFMEQLCAGSEAMHEGDVVIPKALALELLRYLEAAGLAKGA